MPVKTIYCDQISYSKQEIELSIVYYNYAPFKSHKFINSLSSIISNYKMLSERFSYKQTKQMEMANDDKQKIHKKKREKIYRKKGGPNKPK